MDSSAPYGNYHGYYKKRGQILSRDPRLALLDRNLFHSAKVLDVGCNEGWVTYEIALTCGPKKVIGVDIDENLIQAAQKLRRQIWSSCKIKLSTDINGKPLDTGNEDIIPNYFPASLAHSFGPLTITIKDEQSAEKFPHNVVFRTADWSKKGIIDDVDGYDVIIAFSVTKWIHLHNGDSGLLSFFRRVFSLLRPGGSFILEPQGWDSYQRSQRINKSLKENYKNLKFRPEQFPELLIDMGFRLSERFGKGENFGNRSVDLYVKE